MQKQYAEENRPHIEVEFLFERRSFYGLRFINHGKSTAQNVEIQLSDAFIDSLGSTNFAELLKKQKGKKCVIGVNYQSEFDIDTEHYATIFSFESDEEKLLKEMKNQTAELKRMKESIRAIAQNTKQFNTTEESE